MSVLPVTRFVCYCDNLFYCVHCPPFFLKLIYLLSTFDKPPFAFGSSISLIFSICSYIFPIPSIKYTRQYELASFLVLLSSLWSTSPAFFHILESSPLSKDCLPLSVHIHESYRLQFLLFQLVSYLAQMLSLFSFYELHVAPSFVIGVTCLLYNLWVLKKGFCYSRGC